MITFMQILKPNNADIFFSFCRTRNLPYFKLHVLVIHIEMWSLHIMISLSLKKILCNTLCWDWPKGETKGINDEHEVLQSMFKWYTLHNSLSEKRYTYLILVRIIRCVNFCQKKKLLQKTILLLSARCTIFQWIICF